MFTCGSGVTACINMIAYELVSDNPKAIYDGSWTEWDKRKIYQLRNRKFYDKTGNKLDNPVWHSLSENHKEYGITYDDTLFYAPEYCPFGAALNTKRVPTRFANILIYPNFLLLAKSQKSLLL
jgi:hypothetical protein